MSKEHKVIIIPGLGDEISKIQFATNHWRNHGLGPIFHSVGWQDDEKDFQPKLERLVKFIKPKFS
jgi:hypothetical protein